MRPPPRAARSSRSIGTSAPPAVERRPRARAAGPRPICTKLSATTVDALGDAEPRSSTSFAVRLDAGSRTPGALIPLCSPSGPPLTTVVTISCAVGRLHPQFDVPVVEQQAVAAPHRRRERRVGRGHAAGPAHEVAGRRSGASSPSTSWMGRPPARRPVRIFGPLRSCRIATCRPAVAAAARIVRDALGVLLVGAVGEVEAEDVDACGDEVGDGRGTAVPGRVWRRSW